MVYASLETPDLFKDGAEVVVEGELAYRDGSFHADNVLAKCPSKFEAAEAEGGRPRLEPGTGRPRLPVSDLGFYALRFALVGCGARRRRRRLRAASSAAPTGRGRRAAVVAVLRVTVVAMLALFRALATNDFSLAYVASHSARTMPLHYRLGALWGGQAGSLLLWLLDADGLRRRPCSATAARTALMPWVCAVAARERGLLPRPRELRLDPFERAAAGPGAVGRRGLNPLLQHPVMMIHPVMLYTGLHRLRAALRLRLRRARDRRARHDLVPHDAALDALRVDLALASASCSADAGPTRCSAGAATGPGTRSRTPRFMPWLAATAYIHSVMIQEKRDMLRIWNLVLIGLTYGSASSAPSSPQRHRAVGPRLRADSEIFGRSSSATWSISPSASSPLLCRRRRSCAARTSSSPCSRARRASSSTTGSSW